MKNEICIWVVVAITLLSLPCPATGQVEVRAIGMAQDLGLRSALGGVEAYSIKSSVLGEDRRLFVALPPSHGFTSRPYPLIIVFDGASLFAPVATAAAALAEHGHAPEAVIVGVLNTDRLRDLSPPGLPVSGNEGSGRADVFLKFLEDELIPSLASAFRAEGAVTLVGHSSGGLFVHFAAQQRPAMFASVVALDAPMHLADEQMALRFSKQAALAAVPLSLVSMESKFGWAEDTWRDLKATAPSSWRLRRASVDGESHTSMIWPGSYSGLKHLFSWYSSVADAHLPPGERLRSFDARVPIDETIPPARSLLREVVQDQIILLDVEAAGRSLDRLVAAYGDDATAQQLRKRLEAAAGEEVEGPTLAELKAAPRAPAEEVVELVGDWTGYTESEGGTRSVLDLTVRVEAGFPVGEFRFSQGGGHELEYVAVVDNQYRIGYMNRMRPRGMLMYEGTIEDGVFAGEFVLRGVSFRLPDGRSLPRTTFHLEKVN